LDVGPSFLFLVFPLFGCFGLFMIDKVSSHIGPSLLFLVVATPLLEKCEDETHTLEMGTWESTGTLKTSKFNCRGQNTSSWVFILLESY
jgi:hypothetical protein